MSSSCFRYFDLKKVIALSSVIHLNIAFISIYSFNNTSILANIVISLTHSLSSISLFLLIGLVINRTYSRYLDSFFFINSVVRSIILLFILANLSFPGSINFISELLILIAIYSIHYLLLLITLLLAFINTLIWIIIYNKKLPYLNNYTLVRIQYYILNWLLIILYYLGIIYLLLSIIILI